MKEYLEWRFFPEEISIWVWGTKWGRSSLSVGRHHPIWWGPDRTNTEGKLVSSSGSWNNPSFAAVGVRMPDSLSFRLQNLYQSPCPLVLRHLVSLILRSLDMNWTTLSPSQGLQFAGGLSWDRAAIISVTILLLNPLSYIYIRLVLSPWRIWLRHIPIYYHSSSNNSL